MRTPLAMLTLGFAVALASPTHAQQLLVTPPSGGLGTTVTIQATGGGGGGGVRAFDSTTRAVWTGVYAPPVGAPTSQFQMTFNPSDLTVVNATTLRLVIGLGDLPTGINAMNLDGFGVLNGSLRVETVCPEDIDSDGAVGPSDLLAILSAFGSTCPGGGAPCPADIDGDGTVDPGDMLALLASFGAVCVLTDAVNFGVDTGGAVFENVIYPDGFGGIAAPELAGELNELQMILLSLRPDPFGVTPEQLAASAGWAHMAIVLRVDENPESVAAAPLTINADLVTLDSAGVEMDRRTITLVRDDNDSDPANITYHNDLLTPIITVDVPIDPAQVPGFILLFGAADGSATIVPATP